MPPQSFHSLALLRLAALRPLPLLALLVAPLVWAGEPAAKAPPKTRTENAQDVLHGVEIVDPYRWLEDQKGPETRAWIEAQNRISSAYLEAVPGREALRRRLTELWDYERYSAPVARAGRYFFTLNDGLQNQAVLYVADGLAGAPRAILDPNTFSADGTVALTQWVPSEDATLVAYGTSSGGSDWEEWRVREVATGRDLPDRLEWVKFSTAVWTHDGKGFFYSRYDAPAAGEALEAANYHQKLYHHRLGTPQAEDELIYRRPDQKEWGFQGEVTDDGRYLVVQVWKGTETENGILYQDLSIPGAPVVELLTTFDATYGFLGNDGPVFWFQTDLDAPRGRLIAIDTRAPGRARWREVVPEGEDALQ
ncbi:MAG: S9 family peptidase, partial [Thermoanaerobaculia bacterium]